MKAGKQNAERYKLVLYISGMTPAARRAIENLKDLIDEFAAGSFEEVTVIDISQTPEIAEEKKILATPMVIRLLPPPVRRLIGDLSSREQVLLGLDLVEAQADS